METEKKVLPGVFALIKQSIALYKKNFKILVLIGLLPVVVSLVANLIFSLIGIDTNSFDKFSFSLVLLFLLISLVSGVISFSGVIGIMDSIKEIDRGSKVSFKEVYKKSFSLFLSFLWVYILFYLATMGAMILLVIPGIIVGGYLAFSLFVRIVDEKKGLQALSTSHYYVKNNWWRIFGRLIGIGILIGIAMLIIGLVIYLLATLLGCTINLKDSLLNSGSGNIIISSITSLITYCIYMPIGLGCGYFLYKALKLTKPEPNPEVDFKSSRSWFKGLAIFGIALPLIVAIFGIIASIILASLSVARMKANTAAQLQQTITQTQPQFPSTATILPINLTSLESKPYTNKDFGISINVPKKWQVEANAEGIYIASDLKSPVDSDIIIEIKKLPTEAVTVSTDMLMARVSKNILEVASSSLRNVEFKKYNISGKDAYAVTGILKTGDQVINENYYFVRDGLDVYTITAEAKSTSATSVLSTIIDSINTLKITK
jgi:hypothetical protein